MRPHNNNTNQVEEKNPFRNYGNQNYCFTHGHHLEDNHTSHMCSMPGPNHNPNATKFNTMGGTNKGAHKTVMPAQYGRVPNRKEDDKMFCYSIATDNDSNVVIYSDLVGKFSVE